MLNPNLALTPTPTSTSLPRVPLSPRHAAYGLVFSLTIASTHHGYFDIYRRLTLPTLTVAGPGTTCAHSVIREAAFSAPAANPLEALLNQVHADMPEDAWDKVPAIYAADIDKHVYGA